MLSHQPSHHRHELPRPLPGFEKINHYWDSTRNMPAAKITPGEYYVTTNDVLICTVLGSCISVCIRDKVFGIGGMNHFMLPQQSGVSGVDGRATRYGNYAMEHMINDLLKHGALRRNMEVKVTGGGKVINGMTNIGASNIEFVLNYLEMEAMPPVTQDLGGNFPRKVVYYPRTGKLLIKKLRNMHNRTVVAREIHYGESLQSLPLAGEVDLF